MGFYVCLTHVQRERHVAASNNSDCTARFKRYPGLHGRNISEHRDRLSDMRGEAT